MNNLRRILAGFLLIASFCLFIFGQPAFAADLANGKKLFSGNCAACHAGGLNNVVKAKNLKSESLEKYAMNSVEAIAKQIKTGKSAMPAFGKKYTEEQIQDIAAYVLDQAAKGWAKG